MDSHRKKLALIIEDEADIAEILASMIEPLGFVPSFAQNTAEAERMLSNGRFDYVFSDVHMPGKSGIQFLEDLRARDVRIPIWIFVSANGSPDLVEKASRLGAIDVIQKPFTDKDIHFVLKRIADRSEKPLREIMDIVQGITGVQLGPEKELLVETRLMRRARLLGLDSISSYMDYFKEHRKTEVSELVSLVTTHTTEFFREPDHFDVLLDRVLPSLDLKAGPLQFWSAACSTGEEPYSIAISVFEFFREKGIPFNQVPPFEVLGTDIDFNSVERARNGVYSSEAVARLQKDLVDRYFDRGTEDLSHLIRVKDFVHAKCSFKQMNLLSESYDVGKFDVVFLRNVLIYFKSKDVETIVNRIHDRLKPEGTLFLGHSESLTGMATPYKLVGNAIYRKQGAKPITPPSPAAKPASPVEKASPATGTDLTSVMVIDDSATIRAILKRILTAEHGFQVIGEAANPIEAEKILKTIKPDLITLDIHMPEMDGVTYLEKIHGTAHPPIVVISSISYEDAVTGLRCFELGAVDYIEKPKGLNLEIEAERIRVVLKGASHSRKQNFIKASDRAGVIQHFPNGRELIAIGASTGGVEAIRDVLASFPENSPPVLIVQHIPPFFSSAFAKRLNDTCQVEVVEAVDGEIVERGRVYVAPGGRQMGVRADGENLVIEISDAPPVNRHRPSVDFLFESLAKQTGDFQIVAAILTGMGADGARGLKLLRDRGVHTIAQNEETCVVFGMPKEAIQLGGAVEVLPLSSIPYHIFTGFRRKAQAA